MLSTIAYSLLAIAIAAPEDKPQAAKAWSWNQWRGPNRDGMIPASEPAWPDKIGEKDLVKVWSKDDLQSSYSGPIFSADAIFTTETVDKKIERVRAFDRKTGDKLWETSWNGAHTVPFFAAKNGSWIRATPAFDGKHLFVAGIRDLLVCLDAKDGKEVWKFDFPKEFKSALPDFGFVSSPLVDEKGVYVQAGGRFVKIDKVSGKLIWESLNDGGGMNGSAFACPVFAKLGEKEQLVVQTRTHLCGVNPETGKEFWKREIPSFRGMNILTPVVLDGAVFTSTYGGTTQGIKITASGDGLKAEDGWKLKYEGNMTTPVVINDYAYYLGKDRKAICVNVKTGEEAWRSPKAYSEYWSLVGHKDKLLALDSKGTLLLLKANPKEMEILDERIASKEETWAHLAVSGDEIAVRSLNGLTLYRWGKK